jgi:amidase
MGGFRDYDQYDGLGLAELVRRREVAPAELVEEAIRRIEALNPQVNAVIHKTYDLARQAVQRGLPDGPFQGVPFLLKDLITGACAGTPACSGSRFHRDYVTDHDSELVSRYKAAGFVIVGKTNTPEYGLMPVTEPALFGPSRNPWDPVRTPGGSSGGSAAAVASRLVPLAHGSDGGGSIRVPASCCGLFGLKPTRGRNPMGPDLGDLWHGLACSHVITRSVRDSAAALDATAGPDVGAPYYAPPPSRPFLEEVGADPGRLRIAFTATSFLGSSIHADCAAGLAETVALCRDLGHDVREAAPAVDGETFARAFLTLVYVETRAGIEEAQVLAGRRATARDFEPTTWVAGLLGSRVGAPELSRAIYTLQRISRQVGHFFEAHDVLLTPTVATIPPLIGALQPKPILSLGMRLLGGLNAGVLLAWLAARTGTVNDIFEFIPFTPLANVTGQPAMSVPLVWNEAGLPIGMQFTGRYGDEATLFRLAAQLEQARPWANRVPTMCG